MVLFWILNPAIAINELIFGQRIPKISLLDKTSKKSRFERSFIPCPHCGKIHDSRTWSLQNKTSLMNWFGLYCPNCTQIIPCHINVISWLILAGTYPFWIWFKESLKLQWYNKQSARFKNLDLSKVTNPYDGFGWVKVGLGWGLFMYIIMTFIFPLIDQSTINLKSILIGIPIWVSAGLLFGLTSKKILGNKQKVIDN